MHTHIQGHHGNSKAVAMRPLTWRGKQLGLVIWYNFFLVLVACFFVVGWSASWPERSSGAIDLNRMLTATCIPYSAYSFMQSFFFSRYKQLDTSVGHSPESIDGTMLCRAAHNNKIEGSRRHINEWIFDYHSISSTYPNCKWSGWYHQNNTLTVTWDCLCWMHIYFPHTRTLDFCATSVLSCRRFLFFSLCLLQLFNEYLTHNGCTQHKSGAADNVACMLQLCSRQEWPHITILKIWKQPTKINENYS